jgi:hypothetical protein
LERFPPLKIIEDDDDDEDEDDGRMGEKKALKGPGSLDGGSIGPLAQPPFEGG